ncbi:MAG: hypothetical protein MI799_17030 [Desulfobacterales bacterium]|nr:hypothetical protein [Desulfobacterales bacterium]
MPRDVLAERSVRQLGPVIAQEKQRHENRQILLAQIQDFRTVGRHFLKRTRNLAGRDDETVQSFESFFSRYDKALDELEGRQICGAFPPRRGAADVRLIMGLKKRQNH